MKTSNKILLGMVVLIFTVPFLLAVSLKSKMANGEYTVEKNPEPGNRRNAHSGTFTAFRVIRVVGPDPEFLTCHLKLSDTMSYSYRNDNRKDSITVLTSNDTLYISYLAGKEISRSNRQDYNDLDIDVNLPGFSHLVVDGAVVVIDSMQASNSNFSVTLMNNGEVRDGSERRQNTKVPVPAGASRKKETVVNAPARPVSGTIPNSVKPSTLLQGRPQVLDVSINSLLIFHLL